MKRPDASRFRYSLPHLPPAGAVVLPVEDMEKVLLEKLGAEPANPIPAMWELAHFYKQIGKLDLAREQFRHLLDRTEDPEFKAQIVLSLGQTAEKAGDFDLAVEFYRQAMSFEPVHPHAWYFIHNNLGYSLIQLGRFADAEVYCRKAITITPERPNAHKNLGLALQGQDSNMEAAAAFVAASRANASDARALGHLEALLADHPELEYHYTEELESCRAAVAEAAKAVAEVEAAWERCRRPDV